METYLKYEETDQQMEIFKVFEKSGNGSRISLNRSKKRGNSSKSDFLGIYVKFEEIAEMHQKNK